MDGIGEVSTTYGAVARLRSAVVCACVAVTSLAGCATPLFYDENRDKQGQDLKKAVAEAKVADTVGGLEKSFSDMAGLEETRARDRAAYLFDRELQIVSKAENLASKYDSGKGTTDGLYTVVAARLKDLMGKTRTTDDQKAYSAIKAKIESRQRTLDQSLTVFLGTTGHRFDSCQAVYKQLADPAQSDNQPSTEFLESFPADRRELARLKFPEVVDKCKEIDDALKERSEFFVADTEPRLMTLQTRLDELQKELGDYDRDLNAARAKLKADQKAASTPAEGPGTLEKVEDRAKRLGEVVSSLAEGVRAVSDAGEHALAVERLARLEGLLHAIAGTPTDGKVALSEDDRVAVAIIRDLPALADEADKLMKDAARPRLIPFVAAVEQQTIVVRGFEAVRAAKVRRMDAVRRQVAAVMDEVDALVRVLAELDCEPTWHKRSVGALLADLKGQQRVRFLLALAVYADEVKAYRVEGAALAARVNAIAYDEGLIRSKFAAAQWDALINMMATVLADYHAAGIKKADLAEFFKALGLVTIGVGVAQ
ncbi:hypothetical protein [Niveibacterium microcysteis]|uniref:Uncharacterized protein n=1 Tax=Niveibacterium microcysteis TaxID=2811415 RepID=A0ABX7M2G4_9RHOO|nr:hypothetical protein [Niveibacterium microcysteis]QSI75348.1 hypothetical protein JY500_12580 [Niveibacterium microcysteis]